MMVGFILHPFDGVRLPQQGGGGAAPTWRMKQMGMVGLAMIILVLRPPSAMR
jgi:hypothetical protein